MKDFIPISCWAAEDIPSNKLVEANPDHLSNAELLSIIIGTGSDEENSVDLARSILLSCDNSLAVLSRRTPAQLMHLRGVGKQKAAKIIAALKLGQRRWSETAIQLDNLNTATRIYNHMIPIMRDLRVEEFWVMLMNQSFKLIKKLCLSKGGISEVTVDIRLIMKEAVLANSTMLAVCHNHPSGNITPSKFDDQITQSIARACEVMRIRFVDHVIVADGFYYSYHEQGKI